MSGPRAYSDPTPGPRALAAVLIACASLLGACSPTRVVGAGRTFQLALIEYRIVPDKVRAPAGPLTIEVHNYGRLTHNLQISQNGLANATTKPIAPGGTVQLDVTLAPGEYSLSSTILSDQALGAYGTLVITS